MLFVITADRGLCGSFNTNVIKSTSSFIVENRDRKVALGLVGRRGRDYFGRRGFEVRYEQVNLFATLKFADAKAMAKTAIDAFVNGDVDSVYLVYNEFKSVMQQRVVVERLLPIPRDAFSDGAPAATPLVEYMYEPAPDQLFEQPHSEPRRGADLPRAPRIGRRRARRADDGDGRRDAQLGRDDRAVDALHEQSAPGGDYARDHRGGVGGAAFRQLGSGLRVDTSSACGPSREAQALINADKRHLAQWQ